MHAIDRTKPQTVVRLASAVPQQNFGMARAGKRLRLCFRVFAMATIIEQPGVAEIERLSSGVAGKEKCADRTTDDGTIALIEGDGTADCNCACAGAADQKTAPKQLQWQKCCTKDGTACACTASEIRGSKTATIAAPSEDGTVLPVRASRARPADREKTSENGGAAVQ